MQFTDMGDERVRVTLEAGDLTDYKLIYHDFEKNSPKCKRLVLQLMGKARQALGVEYTQTVPSVEVFPAKDGGCVLYFTAKPAEKTKRKQEIWLTSAQLNPLCLAARTLRSLGVRCQDAALWQREKDFLLLLRLSGEDLDRLRPMLAEFGRIGEPWGQSKSFLREHGRPLMEKDAVRQLAALS